MTSLELDLLARQHLCGIGSSWILVLMAVPPTGVSRSGSFIVEQIAVCVIEPIAVSGSLFCHP